MGLFGKKDKAQKATFKDVKTGYFYVLTLLEDRLEINIPFGNEKTAKTLRYDQIKDVVYDFDVKNISVGKSPIGRAVAGGLLFGGAGAVVGAISGTTKKTKKEITFHFIIAYTSKNGEDKFLQYEDSTVFGNKKFANALKERCGIELENQSAEL